jgi:hypothetical protein
MSIEFLKPQVAPSVMDSLFGLDFQLDPDPLPWYQPPTLLEMKMFFQRYPRNTQTHWDLSGSHVNPKVLAFALNVDTAVRTLNLDDTKLTDASLKFLTNHFQNIRELSLSGNYITLEGTTSLMRMLRDPKCRLEQLTMLRQGKSVADVLNFEAMTSTNRRLIRLTMTPNLKENPETWIRYIYYKKAFVTIVDKTVVTEWPHHAVWLLLFVSHGVVAKFLKTDGDRAILYRVVTMLRP